MEKLDEKHAALDRWCSSGKYGSFALFLIVTGFVVVKISNQLELKDIHYAVTFTGYTFVIYGIALYTILFWREKKIEEVRAWSKVKKIKQRKTSQVDPFAEETGLYRITQEINGAPTITHKLFRMMPVDSKTLLPTGGLYRITRVIKPTDVPRKSSAAQPAASQTAAE